MSERKLELMSLASITGADRNPKRHASTELGKSIGRFGYVEPVVLDERTGRLVAGHGRVEALRVERHKGGRPPEGVVEKDGEWFLPVLRGWSSRSDAEASAYLVASNRLTELGGWDEAELGALLKELSEQQALEGVGFDEEQLREALDAAIDAEASVEAGENPYTTEIKIPVYEPKGEKPKVSELLDASKTEELVLEIQNSKLPAEVESFLRHAAQRHTSFNFGKIAEFYCHCDAATKRLFERSALVIIDKDAAIENGFVRLNERFEELIGDENEESDG